MIFCFKTYLLQRISIGKRKKKKKKREVGETVAIALNFKKTKLKYLQHFLF
jgi:hypothetical protein